MINKPSIPKGTRDFSPLTMRKRNLTIGTNNKYYNLIKNPTFYKIKV